MSLCYLVKLPVRLLFAALFLMGAPLVFILAFSMAKGNCKESIVYAWDEVYSFVKFAFTGEA